MVGDDGGIPSDYLVPTQLQFWLFCCCGCCWAVTIIDREIEKEALNYEIASVKEKIEIY